MATETTFDIPKGAFKKDFGVGLDFGGSAIKVLYTSEVEDSIRVHCITKSASTQEETFKFLAEKCKGKLEPGAEIITCGVGAALKTAQLEEALNLKVQNVSELGCLLDGFRYLAANLAWEEFVSRPSDEAMNKVKVWMDETVSMLKLWAEHSKLDLEEMVWVDEINETGVMPRATGDTLQYPALIALVGSASGFILLEEDGSHRLVDEYSFGGKCMLGLAALTAGAKSFDDLVELAARGDCSKVDTMAADYSHIDPDDPSYGIIREMTQKAFPFGKAVRQKISGFSPADLGISVVEFMADMIGNAAFNCVALSGVKQIFFVGSFPCSNQRIQDYLSYITLQGILLHSKKTKCDLYFVKNGQHCGSMGSLLRNLGH